MKKVVIYNAPIIWLLYQFFLSITTILSKIYAKYFERLHYLLKGKRLPKNLKLSEFLSCFSFLFWTYIQTS